MTVRAMPGQTCWVQMIYWNPWDHIPNGRYVSHWVYCQAINNQKETWDIEDINRFHNWRQGWNLDTLIRWLTNRPPVVWLLARFGWKPLAGYAFCERLLRCAVCHEIASSCGCWEGPVNREPSDTYLFEIDGVVVDESAIVAFRERLIEGFRTGRILERIL